MYAIKIKYLIYSVYRTKCCCTYSYYFTIFFVIVSTIFIVIRGLPILYIETSTDLIYSYIRIEFNGRSWQSLPKWCIIKMSLLISWIHVIFYQVPTIITQDIFFIKCINSWIKNKNEISFVLYRYSIIYQMIIRIL